MYLKYLKYCQLVVGLILLSIFIAAPILLPALYPAVYPVMPATDYSTGSIPSLLILLAVGSSNLLSGCYLSALPQGRRVVQGVASILLLTAAGVAAFNTLIHLPSSSFSNSLPFVAVFTMTCGLLLHALVNLHKLGPGHSAVPQEDSSRETGTVTWFNVSKGFGFITRDRGDDIFVHYRAIRGEGHRTLSEGQRVEFLVANREKGLQAEDVISARR